MTRVEKQIAENTAITNSVDTEENELNHLLKPSALTTPHSSGIVFFPIAHDYLVEYTVQKLNQCGFLRDWADERDIEKLYFKNSKNTAQGADITLTLYENDQKLYDVLITRHVDPESQLLNIGCHSKLLTVKQKVELIANFQHCYQQHPEQKEWREEKKYPPNSTDLWCTVNCTNKALLVQAHLKAGFSTVITNGEIFSNDQIGHKEKKCPVTQKF